MAETPEKKTHTTTSTTRPKKAFSHCDHCKRERWGTIPLSEEDEANKKPNGELYDFTCNECGKVSSKISVSGNLMKAP